jgi:hypothetical protein
MTFIFIDNESDWDFKKCFSDTLLFVYNLILRVLKEVSTMFFGTSGKLKTNKHL